MCEQRPACTHHNGSAAIFDNGKGVSNENEEAAGIPYRAEPKDLQIK